MTRAPVQLSPALLKKAFAAEDARRARDKGDREIDLEALSAGHAKQYAFTLDESRWIIALCSRRAGKTTGVAHRFLRRCLKRPLSNRVYIALTKDQARNVTMWEPIWKPLLRSLGIPCKHDETRMITRFDNGSVCRFTGSDDVRHIETELGSALDEAVLDECQSAPASVLEPLIKRILPPALADRRGTLVMAGTVPDVAAGTFWEVWSRSNWSKHNWSMFDNPHIAANAKSDLDEYLANNPGLTIDDPVIQRERFGRFKFDPAATAYTYTQELNGYLPASPDWLDELLGSGFAFCHPTRDGSDGGPRYGLIVSKPRGNKFSFAIDPGSSDRVCIEGLCWGGELPPGHSQHFFEWSTPRHAKVPTHQYYSVAGLAQKHLLATGFVHWRQDTQSQNEIDNLRRDYGIAVVKAAMKSDMAGQIRRVNDQLTMGRAEIMIGSALEQDFQRARFDPDARARGQLKWSSNWHPDPSEAFRYALQDFFAEREKEAPKVYATEIEAAAAQAAESHRERFEKWKPTQHKALPRKANIWGRGWKPGG